jgi:flagellar P-ring protein precursor FlgI
MRHPSMPFTPLLGLLLGLLLAAPAGAERVKDIAAIAGVRENQLVGYGLVVGLDGTGGTSQFTVQSLRSMLTRLGVRVPESIALSPKNVAAVALHASLPPFAKPGQRIDVTVSTLGDAKSLRGGTLLLSPLKGVDGVVYALAQGNLIVGGFGAATEDGNRVSVNIPTVGRVPNGATIERPSPSTVGHADQVVFTLHNPDFTTATRLAEAVNAALGAGSSEPIDAASVRVRAPRDPARQVPFIAALENLEVDPGGAPARVVVNSRTGTVIIGQNVRVTAAAVAHGSLSVTVSNLTQVSQPPPLSGGQTTVVPNSEIRVEEQQARAFVFNPGVSLEEIVRAINQVGAAPSDLVAILEALRAAGALHAELVVI